MSDQFPVVQDALHGSDSKALASRFNAGRFDKDLKWAAERQFASQIVAANEKLQLCTPESLQGALLDVAYSGLSLSPTLAHAYLIPYGKTCKFSPGYRGLMHMAFKAGTVKSVQVNLVYQQDPTFKVWTDENGRHIQHEENQRGKRGNVTHAYCICHLTAGGPPLIEVMSRADLDNIKAAATRRPGGGAVWKQWPEEMMKKSVIRRASKHWPKDAGGMIEHMMQVSDRHDPVNFAPSPDQPPPEAELCMNMDQYTELHDLLLERGISPNDAPEWLRRWAQSKGYATFEDAPGRLFDEAKKTMNEVLDARDRATRTQDSASEAHHQ